MNSKHLNIKELKNEIKDFVYAAFFKPCFDISEHALKRGDSNLPTLELINECEASIFAIADKLGNFAIKKIEETKNSKKARRSSGIISIIEEKKEDGALANEILKKIEEEIGNNYEDFIQALTKKKFNTIQIYASKRVTWLQKLSKLL